MTSHQHISGKPNGFTLLEVIIALAVVGIISAISYPSIRAYSDKYNFRAASREVLTTAMQARSNAVRDNGSWRVQFDPATNSFNLVDPNGTIINRHSLASYGNGIRLINNGENCGSASVNWNGAGISQAAFISFSGRGFGNSVAIFLEDNSNDLCFAVSASNSGVIRLHRYANSTWD